MKEGHEPAYNSGPEGMVENREITMDQIRNDPG